MENTAKEQLKRFIVDSELEFTEGRRNSDAVEVSGYALYLGYTKAEDVKAAIDEIVPGADSDYEDELNRVFAYAKSKNYGEYWVKKLGKLAA